MMGPNMGPGFGPQQGALTAAADPMALYRMALARRMQAMQGQGSAGFAPPNLMGDDPQRGQGGIMGNMAQLAPLLRQSGLLGGQGQGVENSLGGLLGAYSQDVARATGYEGQGPFIPAAWHR